MEPHHYKQALTANLALAQERHAERARSNKHDEHDSAERMLFSLYTEDKNRETIIMLVCRRFNGATFTYTDGLWKGQVEQSVRIDVLSDFGAFATILQLADDIKVRNGQSAVLVTWHRVSTLEV